MASDRSITSEEFPYLPIRVAIRNWEIEAIALLDTGFTGELIIPRDSLPQDFGAPEGFLSIGLGDDETKVLSPLYYGTAAIVGLPSMPDIGIAVIGDEFVVGVGIIRRYRIILEHGDRVIVEL